MKTRKNTNNFTELSEHIIAITENLFNFLNKESFKLDHKARLNSVMNVRNTL